MQAPISTDEVEQGLRLMKEFRKIKNSALREQIIAFVSECETKTELSTTQIVDIAKKSIVQGTSCKG
jgi:hypothetical protein